MNGGGSRGREDIEESVTPTSSEKGRDTDDCNRGAETTID